VFDWLDLSRVALGSAGVALICQTGLVVREWMKGQTEVAKIRATSEGKVAEIGATAHADVTRIWATSEAKIAEMRVAHELGRDRRQLDRPSRRRADLAQLHADRPPSDQLEPPDS
jgi:hypothetical protein